MPNEPNKQGLDVSGEEIKELLRTERSPESLPKLGLFLLGMLLTPITLAGALLGYGRAYNRFLKPRDNYPRLYGLPPIVRVAMIIWWLTCFLRSSFTAHSPAGGAEETPLPWNPGNSARPALPGMTNSPNLMGRTAFILVAVIRFPIKGTY